MTIYTQHALFAHVFVAYIDPTTTSTLLYVLIGVAASVAYALRGVFYRFKDAIRLSAFSTDRTHKKTGRQQLILYSEGKQYWNVFKPIIDGLEALGVASLYVTSDESDPGLGHTSELTCTRYVSPTLTAPFLNHLEAAVVVMTTPQLDVLTIRRSRKVRHYVHVVHAPTDLFTYRKFAFDHFDTVMCAGPHQIRSARYLENKRNRPAKALLETGLTYYDVMLKEQTVSEPRGEKKGRPVVLLAPTWKPYGILNRFGSDFIKRLLEADVDVIVRPHPQSYVSFPELIRHIEQEFAGCSAVSFDRDPSGSASMARSDMMISELSGIIYDYAFLHGKPVLIVDAAPDLRGFEATEVDYPMWEIEVRDRVGRVIQEDDVPSLAAHVKAMLADASNKERIQALRNESIFHFGAAGPVAAKQIADILARYALPDVVPSAADHTTPGSKT